MLSHCAGNEQVFPSIVWHRFVGAFIVLRVESLKHQSKYYPGGTSTIKTHVVGSSSSSSGSSISSSSSNTNCS